MMKPNIEYEGRLLKNKTINRMTKDQIDTALESFLFKI